MDLHVAPMPDDEHVEAVMYGPLVLAGRFDEVSKEKRYGDMQSKPADAFQVPAIVSSTTKADWVEKDPSAPLTFRSVGQSQALTLVPLYKVLNNRLAVYWNVREKEST
jgi:uncharacterized protein